ncbi:MAG: M20/M25/M40 family metallo-hydrolase [Euzebyaceae bacterium]|jgi:acetylornithine deacetylase|nr:M20/M25/M40 family metallo-hydrolase [Euzebyaceae bacterium]
MSLDALERRIVEAVAARRDELVALTCELIRFDTTARGVGDKARDEADLQHYLAQRLERAGAAVDVWQPAASDIAGQPLIPPGLGFDGFPQLIGRFAGSGTGRSLLLNGHIDVVSPEPLDGWTSGPNDPEVRDGLLYGRGACDMKGGIAAMVVAAEVLAAQGVRLAGDLLVNTVTDEETSGAGGVASVAHGVRADGAVVTEPTSLDIGVAFRGSTLATITVPGRAGHATALQPHWTDDGAVNAIEKSVIVLDALRRLRDEWRGRPDHRHAYLSTPNVLVTAMAAGQWEVSYPASASLSCHVTYLPASADDQGGGSAVQREVADWILAAARSDAWLAEHPPTVEWGPDCPPAEVQTAESIVAVVKAAGDDLGQGGALAGADFWSDAVTLNRLAATPAVVAGPGSVKVAHTVNEYVPVDDLVASAQAAALTAMRFCGTAP